MIVRALLLGLCVLAAAPAALGQYPSKPLRMLVGFPPGGANDIVAHIASQKLSDFRAFVNSELDKWAKVVKAAAIRSD